MEEKRKIKKYSVGRLTVEYCKEGLHLTNPVRIFIPADQISVPANNIFILTADEVQELSKLFAKLSTSKKSG